VFDPVAPAETITPAAPVDTLTATPVAFDATVSDIWSNPVAVHWDFGDGQSADGTSASHAFATAGSYLAKATATDASGNTASQTQTVTVAAPPITGGGGGGLARPIAGKTVNLEPVSGVVLVKVPGSSTYVPLVSPTQVQNGSIIDARKGRVRITIDNGKGGLDTAEFYAGIFRFTQPKVKAGLTWFADLYLYGGSFKGCPRAPANPKIAWFSAAKRKTANPKRSVRQLWGSGHGAFRTVGRFSSATIRGTTWLTNDRCDGTLTKVTSGKVGVRDFVLKKTIVLKAHKTYLAKPKPPAKHK
jgi:PKD repeat protein